MLDNLENKVDLINRVMKDFSTNQFATKSDLNGAFNELTKSLRNISNMSSEQIASKFLDNVKRLMDEKHRYLEENLSDFEKYVKSIPKTTNDKEISKMIAEIDDMRSKIEEQETMFANMARALEKTMKENPKPEIDNLRKEFKAFSKGFENVTITLNKNFQTFLEQIQKQANSKEFKKLLSTSETLNKNTNDIMSALSTMDKKYQETKAVLELITSNDANIFKTLEEFKTTANEFESIAPTLKEVSTKEDFNILHERLTAIALFLNNLREFLISTDNQNKEKLNEYSMLIEKRLLEVKNTDDVSKLQGELDVLNKDLRGILNALKTDISNDLINTIEEKSEETQRNFTTQLNKAVDNLSNLANEILSLDNVLNQTLTSTGKDLKADLGQLQEKITGILPGFEASLNKGFGDKILKLGDSINTVNQDNNTKICDALNYHIHNLRQEIAAILPSTQDVQGSVHNVELLVKEVHELDSATAQNLANATSAIKEDLEKLNIKINQTMPSFEQTLNTNVEEKITRIESSFATLSQENYNKICDILNAHITNLKQNIAQIAPNFEMALGESVEGRIVQITGDMNTLNHENYTKICDILNSYMDSIEENISRIAPNVRISLEDSVSNKISQMSEGVNAATQENTAKICEILNMHLNSLRQSISEIAAILPSTQDVQGSVHNVELLVKEVHELDSATAQNLANATSAIKEDLEKLNIKINQTMPSFEQTLNTNVEEKITRIESSFATLSQENYNKICDILNAHITNLKQNIAQIAPNFEMALGESVEGRIVQITGDMNTLNHENYTKICDILNSYMDSIEENISRIAPNVRISLEDSVSNKISQMSEGVNAATQENTAKICEILNMHLNSLRQSISEIAPNISLNNELNSKIEELANKIDEKVNSYANILCDKVEDLKNNIAALAQSNSIEQGMLSGLSDAVDEILEGKLNQEDIASSLSSMGEIIENKISIVGDKINNFKNSQESEINSISENILKLLSNSEKSPAISDTLTNLEGLSNDIAALRNALGENLSQETQSIKENLGQLQEKIEEIEPLITSFFGDGIENKINKIQEIITKASHENYVKIYEIINARIEDFEQNAIEKTNENSAAVKEIIEGLRNEIRGSLAGLTGFKEELAQANKDYVEILQEPMQRVLENLDNLAVGNDLRELSDTVKETAHALEETFALDNLNVGNELRQLSDTVKQTAQTLEETFANIKEDFEKNASNPESETLRNLNETIPQITDKLEIFKTQFVCDNETMIGELKQQFADTGVNVKSEISEILNSTKEDFARIYSSVGEELHLDLQNLSNNIIENIEGVNATILQEFNEHKQNVDTLLSKVSENEERIQDKFNALHSGIDTSAYETRQTLSDTITSVAAEYLETVNGLSTDLLTKMSTIGDISNVGFKEIENLVDKTNRQQILNAKELMEEIQNIIKTQNLQGKAVTQQLDRMGNVNEQIECLQRTIDKELKAGFNKLASIQNPKELNNALQKIYDQLNEIKANSGEGSYDYTLKDVESDIAKLRLVLEKGGSSEVIKSLSTLKSIISDNMKINQNVDQQLSYVNNWLRAAAKTMEILAHKVDKAEKISQEEIKARLLQAEQSRSGLSQEKLDGITANLVKKYKIQEMRLDNIDEKITSLLQKRGEEPDMKAFIDVFYESISQTKSLTTRVENIENQLTNLQKNMEKIISYIEE